MSEKRRPTVDVNLLLIIITIIIITVIIIMSLLKLDKSYVIDFVRFGTC